MKEPGQEYYYKEFDDFWADFKSKMVAREKKAQPMRFKVDPVQFPPIPCVRDGQIVADAAGERGRE